jgi:F420-dependent methylenetetrahydromethanopterin dehydrogenase
MLFNMVMDEVIRRVKGGKEGGLPKIMVYTDNTVIWEPYERTL